MNLLITGALGFVGVNLVRVLAGKPVVTVTAADIHAPDDITLRYLAPVAERVRFAILDVTDRKAVRDLVVAGEITHIVHGAAITPSLQQEAAATTRVIDVNLGGAVNLLDAAVAHNRVQRFLFLSSSGVYGLTGQPADGEIAEDAPLALDNLYAITKRSVELLTARYAALHAKPMASVRLGPIYGPMERPTPSRARLSPPGQLLRALQDARAVTVAGPDVTRDWTYVGDVGEALWALFGAPAWRHSVYNLSFGRPVTLREMVAAFEMHGLDLTWVDEPDAAEIVMRPEQTRTPMNVTRLEADSRYRPATKPSAGVAQCVAQATVA